MRALIIICCAVLAQACATTCPKISPAETKAFLEARADTSGYVIGPGDQIQVETWRAGGAREEQLSRIVTVRPDGKITMPLINDISVIGQTAAQVQAILLKRVEQYVKNPLMTVTVVGYASKQFFIVGQVNNPASYDYRGGMDVLKAVATAGGASPFRAGPAMVVRRKGEQFLRYCVDLNGMLEGDLKTNTKLIPNDVILVF